MIMLNGIPWVDYQGTLIPDTAPHTRVELSDTEARDLLRRTGAYFIRWVSDFDCAHETAFWHVIKDGESRLEALSGNTRHNVRRGLKRCTIRQTDAETVASQGYAAYSKAFAKYETFIEPQSEVLFAQSILGLKVDPQWEFWGVWNDEGRMIAYSMNKIQEGACLYKTTKFDPEYLRLYPSDALFFTMNSHYLNERGLRYIDDGARSISHETNIQEYFIQKFHFRRAYCRLNIIYSPKVHLAVTLLYPFRKLFAGLKHPLAGKIGVLLKHEEIRRSFER
ncbi:GNAT family N-acetyltransferase [Sulfurimonas sp. HSL-3221]|uniref:GNAT family N-acetyltransferase n=1 Tax=Sulfurimonadaceae TaxID=2771471 RepID=UPI001E413B38|nr:GNAT family N-acetyltransferase [Sulfurimonas sp. HSL-3221]UFS62402.1 GNAT family N-acetyltransferase [Sulfurimonas sp. HSL-3221]